MTAINPFTIVPHTRIDNTIILNMHEIGVFGYAVYCAIKMHLNQATGACFPSYATIARITGMNRSTVIEYVKKLAEKKLIAPYHRFKDDGSHTANQYDFQGPEKPGAAKNQGADSSAPVKEVALSTENQGTENSVPAGSRPERPTVVGGDDHPSRPERPEQSEENKKERTNNTDRLFATEKQKTCQHETSPRIVLTEDNLRVCLHCYGLLDENLKLIVEEHGTAERVAA